MQPFGVQPDELVSSCALIQYNVCLHSKFRAECREGHICFSPNYLAGPTPDDIPRVKRQRLNGLQFTTSNALIAQSWKADNFTIAGVCVASSVGAQNKDIAQHPDTYGRVTVQASGIAHLVAGQLDPSICIGQYIAINTAQPLIEEPQQENYYSTFRVVQATPNTRSDRVLGRLCNIRSVADGYTELSVLLLLQTPTKELSIATNMFRSENDLFRSYVPPALLHNIWHKITPNQSDSDATDKQADEALNVLKEAVKVAKDHNMPQAASSLEAAIYENERAGAYSIEFPEAEHMSTVGMQAFLIGNKFQKGIWWYYGSVEQCRSAIPLLLRHRSVSSMHNAADMGMHSASMFWSDKEMNLMTCFLNWARDHSDHIIEPKLENVKTAVQEVINSDLMAHTM